MPLLCRTGIRIIDALSTGAFLQKKTTASTVVFLLDKKAGHARSHLRTTSSGVVYQCPLYDALTQFPIDSHARDSGSTMNETMVYWFTQLKLFLTWNYSPTINLT